MDEIVSLLNGINDRLDRIEDRQRQTEKKIDLLTLDLQQAKDKLEGLQEILSSHSAILRIQARSIHSIATKDDPFEQELMKLSVK
jgi:predicted  nucleic acid-binding Zn-ribbon protein